MKSKAAEPEMTKQKTFFFFFGIYIFWLIKDVILKKVNNFLEQL